MDLRKAKELAASILKIGVTKVYLDPTQSKKIEEAMTKDDIRGLIAERIISKRRENLQSKGRARIMAAKRKKGRKSGKGKRKGTKKSRTEGKSGWMKKPVQNSAKRHFARQKRNIHSSIRSAKTVLR